VKNREHFKNKNIVELGAGAGLSGFVAANFGIEILWCCDIV
jgi:Putative methyltransferase.